MTEKQPSCDTGQNTSKPFSIFRMIVRLLVVAGLSGTVVAAAGLYWSHIISTQPGPHETDILFVVEQGAGRTQLKYALKRAGVIDETSHYHVASVIAARTYMPKAGEYRIPARASISQIMALFHSGRTHFRRITILEGVRSVDVMNSLNEAEGLVSVILRPPAEGSVFPDTYFYSYGDDRRDVLSRMQRKMEMISAEIWAERHDNLPLSSAEDMIILASMIEKETGRDNERELVSSVFVNRLRKRMRLQSDPTVAYGIAGDGMLPETLTRNDLKISHGWNTYTQYGLPKTAIANPSRAALEAAVRPKQSPFLYFVSDARGGHLFATTLAEHNRNVRLYRKRRSEAE